MNRKTILWPSFFLSLGLALLFLPSVLAQPDSGQPAGPALIPTPTPSRTPTSMPGPPILLEPPNGAVLPQPVAPNEWVFRWDARTGPCYSDIYITGPGGRSLGSTQVTYPYEYHYSTTEYLPDDALSPWSWWVDVVCPLGYNHSDTWSFSVEPAPTATPTPTPPAGDLTMVGLVSDVTTGVPIAGANVYLVSCFPRTFSTLSGQDGSYSLFVPESYLHCNTVTIGASASGYVTREYSVSVADLYAQPERNFALQPVTGPLPDLTVSYVKWNMQGYHGGCVPAYTPLVLQITITNQGDGAAGPFTVRATQQLAQQNWPVASLAAHTSIILESTPGVFSTTFDPVTVTADVFGEVAETDESNNVWSQPVPIPTPPAVCTPTPTPTPTAVNLLRNASFEIDADRNDLPDGWTGQNLQAGDVLTMAQAHDGLYSFQMAGARGVRKVLFQTVNQSGPAGQSFTVSGWSQAQNVNGGNDALAVRFFYTDGTRQDTLVPFNQGTHGWQQVQRQVTASKPFNRLAVAVLFFNQTGTVWFDDLSLIRSGVIAMPTNTPLPTLMPGP